MEKYFLFGMIFAGGRLAQDLLCLPFWQILRDFCHFGSVFSLATAIMSADRIGWYNPLLEGVCPDPVDMSDPLPCMGGAMPLANESELRSQLPPISGVRSATNPFAYPFVRWYSDHHTRVPNNHNFSFFS